MPKYIVRHKRTGVTVRVWAKDAVKACQVYGWLPEMCVVALAEAKQSKQRQTPRSQGESSKMATEVLTKSVCDVCGVSNVRAGAEGGVPPAQWSELVLTKRFHGEGWSHSVSSKRQLCPNCAMKVLDFLDNQPRGEMS